VAALVPRSIVVPTPGGGHRHTAELRRWDHVFPDETAGRAGLEDLVVAAVRAAVLVPEKEVRSWFSWPLDVIPERLDRPAPGWLAAPASA
jgi:hypothetical protein